MRVEWHGQSAFTLSSGSRTVVIDPFQDIGPLARERGMTFDYPPIEIGPADLLLVTHEHVDHNGVERVSGEPQTSRATAGRHQSPLGEVVGIASEHDRVAGTERGPNTIFVFELEGLRVVHFGDFGQDQLRSEQSAAEFVAAMPALQRLDSPGFDTGELRRNGKPLAVVPAAP